jgi:hypothetical protein
MLAITLTSGASPFQNSVKNTRLGEVLERWQEADGAVRDARYKYVVTLDDKVWGTKGTWSVEASSHKPDLFEGIRPIPDLSSFRWKDGCRAGAAVR